MPRRAPLVALDVLAVLVFVATGRRSHAEGLDVLGILGTAAPFLLGAAVGALAARSWREPVSWRAGLWTWAAAAVLGLALRAAVTGRLPVSFAVVATVALGVLILGWRGVAQLVARTRRRVGGNA